MKKKWIIISIVTIIVVLVALNIWKMQATTNVNVETVTLREEEVKETILTPGTLKLKDEQYVYYEADKGEIAEIFVEAGDKVKKGDELLKYENKQLELEKKQNDLQLRSTSLQLENIRKQHREIDKALEKDKENELLQQEHDDIKLQEQMTVIELEQSQLQQESITKQMADLTVKAKVAGTVLNVNEDAGTDALTQEPLIQIGSFSNFIVEGTISEYDTLNIEAGQEVILTSDAVVDKEWKGVVDFIGDLPINELGTELGQESTSVLYPITVTVEDDIELKPGFKMVIEIVVREEKVQALPIEAVLQEDDATYVYIVEDGKAKRVDVKIGTANTEIIEIVEGIDQDDEVILNPSDDITDGTEVTIK